MGNKEESGTCPKEKGFIFHINIFRKKNRHHLVRPFPTSIMSIEDFRNKGAVFITIERDSDSSIDSMVRRAGQSRVQAMKEYKLGMDIINNLKSEKTYSLTFLDLVNKTLYLLRPY